MNTISIDAEIAMINFGIMTNGLEKLGEKVRCLREVGWRSQEKFVTHLKDAFGVSLHQTSLSAIERGEKFPSVETLALLARALETNADYLLGLTDDERPHGQLDDQVVVTVVDPVDRKMMQEAIEMLARASKDDKEYIVSLIRRLSPKKPRIIGDE
jgi:transcriptional regulator with XRE-family HTH domain